MRPSSRHTPDPVRSGVRGKRRHLACQRRLERRPRFRGRLLHPFGRHASSNECDLAPRTLDSRAPRLVNCPNAPSHRGTPGLAHLRVEKIGVTRSSQSQTKPQVPRDAGEAIPLAAVATEAVDLDCIVRSVFHPGPYKGKKLTVGGSSNYGAAYGL